MLCPRCRIPLNSRPHATGVAWGCGRCAGQSLNFSQFRKLLPQLQANEIWLTVMENPVVPQKRACCPECRTAMAAVLIPLESGGTQLDVCPPCQRLWMDPPARQARQLEEGLLAPGLREELPVVKMEGRRQERRAGRKGGNLDDPPGYSAFLAWLADWAGRARGWLRLVLSRCGGKR
ncbi:MAG: hypothetical protein V4726_20700 [Verrucomicrobiota bacterium]